jgi:hypothetical protein
MYLGITNQQLYTTTQRSKQMINKTKQNAMCLQIRKNQKQTEEEFKAIIIESVDESFASFSNLNKQAVYLHLEKTYNIKKEEIPCKMDKFTDAIEQMFGIGVKLVEMRIIKALHKRIPEFVFFPMKLEIGFKEYVASLHIFLLQTS